MIAAEAVLDLSDDEIHRILKVVETRALVIVLAQASPAIRDRVQAAAGRRAGGLIADEIDLLPPIGTEETAWAEATFCRQMREGVADGVVSERVCALLEGRI